jgi:hypothetical protein
MPWIPMYLAADDVVGVLEMLNADEEVAFLVKDGPNRWKAILSVPTLPPGRIAIWHIPSGPPPLLAADKQQHDGQVQDAFSGWNELLIGADPTTPYFGAGHPGVIWLNLHVSPSERNSVGGMSSFEWIGNHYRIIGSPAAKTTELWWKSLRRRIQKVSNKVPRQGLTGQSPEIFAYPAALGLLEKGQWFDANPSASR